MVYAQPSICTGEWDTQTPLGFWQTNGSPNLSQTTGPYNNQQKRENLQIMEFAVPVDHKVKLKECEKGVSTSTLQGNWKICETWKWRLYQM